MIRVAGGDTSPENVETLVTMNPGRGGRSVLSPSFYHTRFVISLIIPLHFVFYFTVLLLFYSVFLPHFGSTLEINDLFVIFRSFFPRPLSIVYLFAFFQGLIHFWPNYFRPNYFWPNYFWPNYFWPNYFWRKKCIFA